MTLRRVDLHLHTVASDGTWTPEEAVEAAQKAGLGIMAITDHDSVKSVAAAQKAAQAAGIAFHTGTEICSTYQNHCFHILGYDIDIYNQELLDQAQEQFEALMKLIDSMSAAERDSIFDFSGLA